MGKNMILEIAAIAAAIGTFANAVLYVGGFFRKLENQYQDDRSKINARLYKLEGQVDALINKSS